MLRTQQQLAAKRKRFMDGVNSFAAKQREAVEQYQKELQQQQQDDTTDNSELLPPSEKKETGGVM